MSLLIDSKQPYSISTFAFGVLIFGIVMNRIPLSCLAETCSISMSSVNLIVLAASPFLPAVIMNLGLESSGHSIFSKMFANLTLRVIEFLVASISISSFATPARYACR